VAASIEPGLFATEFARAGREPPAALDVWGLVVTAIGLVQRFERAANERARVLLAQALERQPDHAHAHAIMSWALTWAHHCFWGEDRGALLDAALRHADLALTHDASDPWAHAALGFTQSFRRRHEEARASLSRALDLNPSFALGRMLLGWASIRGGWNDSAIAETAHALRLSPQGSFASVYQATHGLALLAARRFEEAVPFLRASLLPRTEYHGHVVALVSCCGHLGRLEEAKRLLEDRARRLAVPIALGRASTELAGYAHHDVFIEGLRLAGVPNPLPDG
jgi:adenylate cyclase